MSLFAANGIQDAFSRATLDGLIIVGALLLLSIFSWSVMLSKLYVLRRTRKQTEHFLEMFRGQQNPLELFEMGNRFPYAPAAHVYRAAAREISYYLLSPLEKEGHMVTRINLSPKITPSQMESVDAAMDRAVGEAAIHLEDKTTILATAVSGAPFLGLLGTVWGVMDTFSAVARDASMASLQSIAPGVSSALLTTVIGLLVAIPAMFGYNYIVSRIRQMISGLENFTAELHSVFTRHFVDHGPVNRGEPFDLRDDAPYHPPTADAYAPYRPPAINPDGRLDPIHSRPPSAEPIPTPSHLGQPIT